MAITITGFQIDNFVAIHLHLMFSFQNFNSQVRPKIFLSIYFKAVIIIIVDIANNSIIENIIFKFRIYFHSIVRAKAIS